MAWLDDAVGYQLAGDSGSATQLMAEGISNAASMGRPKRLRIAANGIPLSRIVWFATPCGEACLPAPLQGAMVFGMRDLRLRSAYLGLFPGRPVGAFEEAA